MVDYIIRDYAPQDTSSVLALIQEALGGGPTGTRSERFWRWKHLDNPFGSSLVLVAVSPDERIIGVRPFMRWRLRSNSYILEGVRGTDVATDPRYRRGGVFASLTHKAIERAKGDGVSLIFNHPNEKVISGYLKWGWQQISLIRPLIKVLNYPRLAVGLLRSRGRPESSQMLPSRQFLKQDLPPVAEMLSQPNTLESLLQTHSQMLAGRLSTDRTIQYLRWRYSEHPYIDYRVVYRKDSGEVSGCAIVRPNARSGLKEAILNELLLAKPDEDLASSLLNELERCLNADYIVAYFPEGTFERHILRTHGFHQAPIGVRHFMVNVLASRLPKDPLQFANWYLSLGDLEVF
jgi:GNAT superfamily N-acetyltransferase